MKKKKKKFPSIQNVIKIDWDKKKRTNYQINNYRFQSTAYKSPVISFIYTGIVYKQDKGFDSKETR